MDDLSNHIDRSPHGLVDDYPKQCFPCDVACAIAIIAQAASALQEDRNDWAHTAYERLAKTFDGYLPPYMAQRNTAIPLGPSRGCTNGFFFTYLPELSPQTSKEMYQKYVNEFWQYAYGAYGWREFSRKSSFPSSYYDPDSGPVIAGFGTGATGLGIGCTRVQGDDEKAGALAAQMLVTAIPQPNGTLLLPRLVSDRVHAPYFAEITILHQLSLLPHESTASNHRAKIPPIVWAFLALELALVVLFGRICWGLLRR